MKNLKFSQLLAQQLRREYSVLARIYSNGSWHQFSGKDVCAHIYLATQYWADILPIPASQSKNTNKNLIFITSNSYHAFVASIAAVIRGFHVMWLPMQMPAQDIQSVIDNFPCLAIVTDMDDYASYWKTLNVPVIGIHDIFWMEREKFLDNQDDKFKNLLKRTLGTFRFMSFGHDGIPKHEIIQMNAFITTAQNFIEHCNVPAHILWQSFEIMPPSHPFAHLSKFCALLKNGVMGFPNYGSDLETSLSILQPTYFFASRIELEQISAVFQMYSNQSSSFLHKKIKKTVNRMQKFLGTSKAMKIPEGIFSVLKRTARMTSKMISSDSFISNGLDNLQFIVHGFTSASKKHVQLFESYGIPVIETYGTTHAAGMLSSNTFQTPHLNIIGTPLPHVYFRLGFQSTLEYKLSTNDFTESDIWHETGDIVQMTPFGFILTGRKKHLFTTMGGSIIAPAQIEKMLKENPAILDVCIVGDKRPYLCALVAINKEFFRKGMKNKSLTNDMIRNHVQEIISQVNEKIPRNVTIKKFHIMDKPFTKAHGERLSNGEIDRLQISEQRSQMISEFYVQ